MRKHKTEKGDSRRGARATLPASRTRAELCAPLAQPSKPSRGPAPLRRSGLVRLRILGFLLGYFYKAGQNPIEAFALDEAIKDSFRAIMKEHIVATNPHAKWFITFTQGFVTGVGP